MEKVNYSNSLPPQYQSWIDFLNECQVKIPDFDNVQEIKINQFRNTSVFLVSFLKEKALAEFLENQLTHDDFSFLRMKLYKDSGGGPEYDHLRDILRKVLKTVKHK